MECDAAGGAGPSNSPDDKQALNSTILDYYKKFGRKRDLEQYFSLNTAQGEIKDVSSLFWRRMKSQDSSDSGEKSRDASLEVCRIRIECSAGDLGAGSSQDENPKAKSDTESPPIINEEGPKALDTSQHSDANSVKSDDNDDDKSVKSEDNHSQKSIEANLDTSINKAYSPSSSITSQRRLEWDSLADVGYANESDKKTSASSLSTLERLALKQQYSNNDTHHENLMGLPTAHSTPVDEAEMKTNRKSSRTTKIYRKDVDCVEVNVPQGADANPSQSINVNLTKHISFSVDKGGEVSVGNVKKDYSVSPEKKSVDAKESQETLDKEIQTSLIKTKDKSSSSGEVHRSVQLYGQGIPVLINLNNLKRARRKKLHLARKKSQIRKQLDAEKENVPVLEKSGEQVSEAESFEYMPGHIYNQNQMNKEPARSNQTAGNKSSLESSGALTTDSSKGSKHSFTKDLEKSIKLLRSALNKRYDDAELKKKLIKNVVQKLLDSNYRDDETTTDFLSGLSFSSRKLGLGGNNTTTSTSDANNTTEKLKIPRPKKSILRVDKFNPSVIASTSQSAPNLPIASNSENPVSSKLAQLLTTSNSPSDASSKERTSSDTAFAKTSSEELYLKYLDALRREEAYKKHLREKEQFLKQKLVASEAVIRSSTTLTGPASRLDVKSRLKLKELMKDLTRNNYDDGSGDASKLEGGLASDMGLRLNEGRSQRSHSVFTLSSSENSDKSRKSNMKKSEIKDSPKAGHSKDEKHYCCCPHHFGNKIGVTDSSVQVNIRSDYASPRINNNVAYDQPCPENARATQPASRVNVRSQGNSPRISDNVVKAKKCSQPLTHIVSDENTGDIKYLCLCKTNEAEVQSPTENFMIYKCSRLRSKGVCCDVPEMPKPKLRSQNYDSEDTKPSKGSQTLIKKPDTARDSVCVHEAIRVTQTDISINPRISDPSLSDIKITNNSDCVKLVREQFRQVSKTSVDSEGNTAQIGENDIYSQPSTSTCRTSKENTNRLTANVEIQSDVDLQGRQAQIRAFYGDDGGYTIPIQGTNMTLKVSVGPKPITNLKVLDSRELGRPLDAIDSDEIIYARENDNVVNTMENATSLTEECSKGVQAVNKGLFSQYERKPRTVNTIFTKHDAFDLQANASSSRPQRKLFMRSNTFAGIEEGNAATRNEILEDFYDQEQWASYSVSSNQRNLCACPNPNQCSCSENKVPKTLCACPRPIQSREALLSQFNEPETKDVDSVDSQNDFQEPVKKVDTGCGPEDGMKLDQNTDYIDHTLRSKKLCPCPQPSPCYNECQEDAACWNKLDLDECKPGDKKDQKAHCGCPDSAKCGGYCGDNAACRKQNIPGDTTLRSRSSTPDRDECKPEVKKKQKAHCGCPDSAKCGGYCGKNAACRQQHVPDGPILRSRPSTPNRDECKSEVKRKQKSHCGCPDSAKCGGYCGKNAACRKHHVPDGSKFDSKPSTPRKKSSSPPKSPSHSLRKCPCPDSAKCGSRCGKDAACRSEAWAEPEDICELPRSPRISECVDNKSLRSGSPVGTALRSGSPVGKASKPASPRKFPCSCQNSAKCGGFCTKDAPCRPKPSEVKESGPDGDTGSCNSPPENSDSDQADFEKLKTFLRSQTFPLGGIKQTKSFRSHSLPVGPKAYVRNPGATSTEVDESPSEELISAPGTSKIKTSDSNVLIMNIIRDITNRYSKQGLEKSHKKKCFKEILSILNYLLDTEDAIDCDAIRGLRNLVTESTSSESNDCVIPPKRVTAPPVTDCNLTLQAPADSMPPPPTDCVPPPPPQPAPVEKKTCDKGIQLCAKKPKLPKCCTESSDLPSSEHHGTSSDSVTCKVLNKIRKECEKYHRKCCKRPTSPKRCQCSSTTSMSCDQCKRIVFCKCRSISANCDQCKRVHHCSCRPQNRCKCKGYRPKTVCERVKKKCVAYNLIIQTSESMVSEEITESGRPLKNIIVKVPSRKTSATNVPFKEMEYEIGQRSRARSEGRSHRSKSLPNDSLSSTDDGIKGTMCSVKDYLERNRPDFIEKSGQRQKCLKMISEARASHRTAQRKLLSMQVQVEPALRALSESDLRLLAEQLGLNLRQKKEPPKLISEREMKKHSERIYKKLPEVVQKKEDLKKENIKKTNLLMASIFKKNLQKKTLRGAVNLSNYSTVVKI